MPVSSATAGTAAAGVGVALTGAVPLAVGCEAVGAAETIAVVLGWFVPLPPTLAIALLLLAGADAAGALFSCLTSHAGRLSILRRGCGLGDRGLFVPDACCCWCCC